MLNFLPFVLTASAIALVMVAALHDVATRTIPDWIPAGLALAGVALRLQAGDATAGIVMALLLLVAMAVLWFRGFIGGGDAKLVPAAALVLPSSTIGLYVCVIAMAGGGLAALYLALSVVVRRPAPGMRRSLMARLLKAEAWRVHRRGGIPYAVAIAAGGMFILLPMFSR
jgi:prepilin peptidase CpaA